MWFSCNALPVPDCLNDCCEAQCFCSSNSPRLKPNNDSELAYSNTSQENCLGFPCSCGRARRVGPELGLTSLSESPSLSKITRDAQSVVKPINPRQALSERLQSWRLTAVAFIAVTPKDSPTTTIMQRLVALLLAAAATAASADRSSRRSRACSPGPTLPWWTRSRDAGPFCGVLLLQF